ncbi:MAG: hypothetical protein JRI45_02620 [Deltaproteobacteria bacterium]|nr:hypothetical protein [Deltaproteobacteria bacterium]MBW2068810.1 hypothetical protein [Deltaproteobacteria bacterium]
METSNLPEVKSGVFDLLDAKLMGGEIGVIVSRAGVGKTAFLTLIALEEISSGGKILHVCIDEPPDKIRTWYEELLRVHGNLTSTTVLKGLVKSIEPQRFIVSFLHNSFSLQKLAETLENVSGQARFKPSLVVLDGLDFERYDKTFFSNMKKLLNDQEIPMWASARTHRHLEEENPKKIPHPCNNFEELLDVIVILAPTPEGNISLRVAKDRKVYNPEGKEVILKPQVFVPCQ